MVALAQLQELWLSDNQIGDVGLTALSNACAGGALAQLQKLFLDGNQVGDVGLTALANACASGALPSLTQLLVDDAEHPELKAACEARGIDVDM